MLKTYRQFLKEVEFIDRGHPRSDKLGTFVNRSFNRSVSELERDRGRREVESYPLDKDHILHHYSYGPAVRGQHDVVVEHHGKVSHHIVLSHPNFSFHKDVFHVDDAASSGKSPIKMHDVYHHLLKHGMTLVGGEQTPGGMHIWHELQKKKDVNIHGYDPVTRKAVNVDMKGDPLETHATRDQAYNHWNDNPEFEKTHRMNLIAHIKDKRDR